MVADRFEVVPDGILPANVEGAEPGLVSRRGARDTINVSVGLTGVSLGAINGILEEDLFDPRAAREGSPLVVGAGDCEIARELNLSNILNCGVEVLGGAIRIDVDEQV